MINIKTLLFLVLGLVTLAGCAINGKVADGVTPLVAERELTASELLDVSITVFSSAELTDEDLEEKGLSTEIRDAEARFIPLHLKYTLQRTGYWGMVRVVPSGNQADVLIHGKINRSDGVLLSLDIRVNDAKGMLWYEKTYTEKVQPSDHDSTVPEQRDAYQDLYNSIANDLVKYRLKLTKDEVSEIRQVAELRFAKEMAPDAFQGYYTVDSREHYQLQRLPAADDPMMRRVRAVEMRNDMLIDTINNYYDVYYQDLWQPYADWRRLFSEEAAALQEVREQAITRTLLGLASIVGAVAISSSNSDLSRSNLPDVMVLGGAAAMYSGFQKSQETKIHKDVIEELSLSFSAEAEPLVVEVMGETVRLTGSAEEQYAKWRGLMRDIYQAETGLPVDSGTAVDDVLPQDLINSAGSVSETE